MMYDISREHETGVARSDRGAPVLSQNAPCSRNSSSAGTGALIAALLGVTYRMTTAPEVEASTPADRGRGLVAAPEPEREASTGSSARRRGTEESGVKESSAESSKASRPRGKPPESCDAAESERLPVPLWLWITLAWHRLIALIYCSGAGSGWKYSRCCSLVLPLALMILGAGFDRVRAGDASEAAAIAGSADSSRGVYA